MKQGLALLLTVCLLVACSCTALAGDEVLHGYVSDWDNYGLSTDPITLTIGCGIQDMPASVIDNLQIELIAQATGVRLDFVGYDPDKFAVLTAGGDLPDILQIRGMYPGGASAGVSEGIGLFLRALHLLVKTLGKEYTGEQEEEFHTHCAVRKESHPDAVPERRCADGVLADVEEQYCHAKDKTHQLEGAVSFLGRGSH